MIFLESLQPFCLKTSQLSNCCTLSSPVESLAILGTCFYRSGSLPVTQPRSCGSCGYKNRSDALIFMCVCFFLHGCVVLHLLQNKLHISRLIVIEGFCYFTFISRFIGACLPLLRKFIQ